MNDKLTVKLTIASSTLSAKEIESLLGLRADVCQVMGEMNRLGTKIYPQHAWILKSSCELESAAMADQMEAHISQFLDRLTSVSSAVKSISSKHFVELGIYVLARDVPPLNFPSKQVAATAELGASIDVDIVLYADEKN